MTIPACRLCAAPLMLSLIDLGAMPLANRLVEPQSLEAPEPAYPLHVMVCEGCWLVQLAETVPPATMFADYPYFSSVSPGWVAQAQRFAESAIARFGLSATSLIVEIASNDGYLLRHFQSRGIPCLGIEPAANIAAAAIAAGIATETQFFGHHFARGLAERRGQADLIIANNVLAHAPDLKDFVSGLAELLAPGGTISIEVPHLLNLMRETQFDTIYHEHVFYFSLLALTRLAASHGLRIVDIEELPSHGGSLRLFLRHRTDSDAPSAAVEAMLARERAAGLDRAAAYAAFAAAADAIRTGLTGFLGDARRAGKRVAAYGAAAKGATLLNSCGIGCDAIDYVADLSPHKQGRAMPGSHLPIVSPSHIAETRPDYLLILPWNLADEIIASLPQLSSWGGRFVTAVPRLDIRRHPLPATA